MTITVVASKHERRNHVFLREALLKQIPFFYLDGYRNLERKLLRGLFRIVQQQVGIHDVTRTTKAV